MPKILSENDLCDHLKQNLKKGVIKKCNDGYWIYMESVDGNHKEMSIIHYCYRCGLKIWEEE